jgi:hypothetical protein
MDTTVEQNLPSAKTGMLFAGRIPELPKGLNPLDQQTNRVATLPISPELDTIVQEHIMHHSSK